MTQDEQPLADELEELLSAAQRNRPVPPTHVPPDEADLARELVRLAHDTEADPAFVAELHTRLQTRAAQLQPTKQTMSPAPAPVSFWRRLKDGWTMKRLATLGAVAALFIVIAGVGIWRLLDTDDGGEPPVVAEATVEAPAGESPAIPTDAAVDEGPAEPETGSPTAEATGAPPTDLAALPAFDPQSASLPAGAGGGIGANNPAESSMMPTDDFLPLPANPFSGTQFTLNATLPVEPTVGTVLRRPAEVELTAEMARAIADRYGFSGPLYTEVPPADVPMPQGAAAPPVGYVAFDGPRTLRIDPWSVNFSDESVMREFGLGAPGLSFEEAAPIAEAFLQERGLLDFPYQIDQLFPGEIRFLRLVDGRPALEAAIAVGIGSGGQIAFVNQVGLAPWENLGEYPLIGADAAWQQIVDGVTENGIIFAVRPAGEMQVMPGGPPADFQSWQRSYGPGEEVHLYEFPIVYRPVNDGPPLIRLRTLTVEADAATLNEIAEYSGGQLHLWGRISDDGGRLLLDGWEPLTDYTPIYLEGVVRREGDLALFVGNEGETYALPSAPADLPEERAVYVFGFGVRDAGLAYPALDWETIETVVEREGPPPVEEPLPPAGPQPLPAESFSYQSVTISEVSVAVFTTYQWPEMPEGEEMARRPAPTLVLQPAWRFTGVTDSGETVDFYVQAVDPAYIAP